jgi:hypothetical protein
MSEGHDAPDDAPRRTCGNCRFWEHATWWGENGNCLNAANKGRVRVVLLGFRNDFCCDLWENGKV